MSEHGTREQHQQQSHAWETYARIGGACPEWVDFDDPDERLDALAELIRWAVSAPAPRRDPLALTAHRAYLQLTIKQQLALDALLRHDDPVQWTGNAAWRTLDAPSALRFDAETAANQFLRCCLSAHPSGHVRQAVVTSFGLVPAQTALPWLLLRRNDWVPQVRHAAEQALLARLQDPAGAWPVACFGYARVASAWSRAELASLLNSVRHRAALAATIAQWEQALTSADPDLRRGAATGLASMASPPVECIELALKSPDPQVQGAALRRADSIGDESLRLKWQRFALFEANPRLRRDVFLRLVSRSPRALPDTAANFLFSHSAIVRHAAQRWMRSYRDTDPAPLYRNALAGGGANQRAFAVLGLSQCAEVRDRELIASLATDASPSVRAACIEALATFDSDGIAARCIAAVIDPSARVFRSARRMLRRARTQIDIVALWQATGSRGADAQLRALTCVAHAARWEALIVLLQSLSVDAPEVRKSGRQHLSGWIQRLNRSSGTPTADQASAIRRLLDDLTDEIDPNLVKTLRFLL